jgi:hypothetical protein
VLLGGAVVQRHVIVEVVPVFLVALRSQTVSQCWSLLGFRLGTYVVLRAAAPPP